MRKEGKTHNADPNAQQANVGLPTASSSTCHPRLWGRRAREITSMSAYPLPFESWSTCRTGASLSSEFSIVNLRPRPGFEPAADRCAEARARARGGGEGDGRPWHGQRASGLGVLRADLAHSDGLDHLIEKEMAVVAKEIGAGKPAGARGRPRLRCLPSGQPIVPTLQPTVRSVQQASRLPASRRSPSLPQ